MLKVGMIETYCYCLFNMVKNTLYFDNISACFLRVTKYNMILELFPQFKLLILRTLIKAAEKHTTIKNNKYRIFQCTQNLVKTNTQL